MMGAHCFDNKEQQKKTAIAIAIASRFYKDNGNGIDDDREDEDKQAPNMDRSSRGR